MKIFFGLRDRVSIESGIIEKKRKDFFAAKGFLTEDEAKERGCCVCLDEVGEAV